MKNIFKLFLLSVSFVICLSSITFGQRTTGSLEGTVKDATGAVVPNVSVTLTGTSVGFNRTVQTDSNGIYRFQQIPSGTYKLTTAAISGFAETALDNVTVNLEKTTITDVTLSASGGVTTVDVTTGNDPLGANVDTTDSKVQTNITSELIDQLPKGTTFTSLLKVSPGTRSEAGQFQVDGASGAENSFVIDGQTLENFRTGTLNANNNVPTSLVQEIQIKTSGFEAEHGGASGGVISVQTKGGSDVWRGEFGMQFETSKLQPGPRFVASRFASSTAPQYVYGIRPPRESYTNVFPTASLGGAIVKGRVWFYGNYSPQFFPQTTTTTFYNSLNSSSFINPGSTNQAGAGVASGVNLRLNTTYPPKTYQFKRKQEFAFGRIDANIFNNLRYSGTYLWNPTVNEGVLPYGTIAVGSVPVNKPYNGALIEDSIYQSYRGGRTNSNNLTQSLYYTPTSNMVVTGRYARGFLNEKNGNYAIGNQQRFLCTGGDPNAYIASITGCQFGFDSGTNDATIRDVSLRNEINGDVTYIVGNFAGRHEFKGGIQYGTTKNDVSNGTGATDASYRFNGRNYLYYGQNFSDGPEISNIDQFCNLRTADNPTGDCLGVGELYRFGTAGIGKNKYIGLFIQDKWQPTSRLTLNLGVRIEKENLPAYNVGDGRPGIPLEFGFGKKIAPRLGGAYDLFGDGKTRLFASYGRFFDRLKFALPRGSFGGDFYRFDYFPILASNPNYTYYTTDRIIGKGTDPIGGSLTGSQGKGGLSVFQVDQRIPSNITAEQATALGLPFAGLDSDLKPFRQDEITVGFERELSRLFVLSTRFTRKNVASATEDHGILGAGGSENYIISNPGEGKALELDKAVGYIKSLKPQRLYRALEVSLTKRLSSNYFFNVSYTWSRLFGNYSGLGSTDEQSAAGVQRTDPGVTRYFDYIVNGFTFNGTPDNGLLPTDRTHTFKAYGAYDFDWFGSKTNSTEISFFQQILQGTPETTYIGVENSSIVFDKRGDLGRTPTFWQTDLSLSHKYRFGRDSRYTIAFEVNALNALNNQSIIRLNTTRYNVNNTVVFSAIDPAYKQTSNPVNALNAILGGKFTPAMADAYLASRPGNTRNVLYGQPSVVQGGRNIRFGMRFFF